MLDVKPHEFLQYGLGCLEMLTGLGDSCAKETRKRIRIMVCSISQVCFNMLLFSHDKCTILGFTEPHTLTN